MWKKKKKRKKKRSGYFPFHPSLPARANASPPPPPRPGHHPPGPPLREWAPRPGRTFLADQLLRVSGRGRVLGAFFCVCVSSRASDAARALSPPLSCLRPPAPHLRHPTPPTSQPDDDDDTTPSPSSSTRTALNGAATGGAASPSPSPSSPVAGVVAGAAGSAARLVGGATAAGAAAAAKLESFRLPELDEDQASGERRERERRGGGEGPQVSLLSSRACFLHTHFFFFPHFSVTV